MNPYYSLALDPRTGQPRRFGIATEADPYLLPETDEQNAAADAELFWEIRQELIDSLTTTGDLTQYQRDQWRDLWGVNFEDAQARIRMLEQSLKLEETGDLDRMVENYRQHYYTPLCRGRMETRECWDGAVAHGDLAVVKEFWAEHEAGRSFFPPRDVLEGSVIMAIENGGYPMVRLLNSMHNDFPALMHLELEAAVRADKRETTRMLIAKTATQYEELLADALATVFSSMVRYDRKDLLDYLWRFTDVGPVVFQPRVGVFIPSGGVEIGRSGRMEWVEFIQNYAGFQAYEQDQLLSAVILGAYEAGHIQDAPFEDASSAVLRPIIVRAFADGNFDAAKLLLHARMKKRDPRDLRLFAEAIVMAAATSLSTLRWLDSRLDFRGYSGGWKGDNNMDVYPPYMSAAGTGDVVEYHVYDNGVHVGNTSMAPVLLAYRRSGRDNAEVAALLGGYLGPLDR